MARSFSQVVRAGKALVAVALVGGPVSASPVAAQAEGPPTASFPVYSPTARPVPPPVAPPAPPAPSYYPPPAPSSYYPPPARNYYSPPAPSYPPPTPTYAPPPARPSYVPLPPTGRQPGPPALRRAAGEDPALDRAAATEEGEKGSGRDWMFSLEAVTNAPVDIGGRVTIEAPFRVRLSMGFGAIPGAYVGLINDALATAGAYDGFVARSVDAAFNRGTSWRSQIGLRPFKNSGFYLDGGYAVITLQGRLSGSDVAAMAANFDVDTTGIDQGAYELETEVRMWAAEMGWQGQLNDGLVFGIGIGVLGTLSSKSLVRTSSEAGSSGPQGLATTAAVAFLDQQIETYGYLPTLTVRLGYDLL